MDNVLKYEVRFFFYFPLRLLEQQTFMCLIKTFSGLEPYFMMWNVNFLENLGIPLCEDRAIYLSDNQQQANVVFRKIAIRTDILTWSGDG